MIIKLDESKNSFIKLNVTNNFIYVILNINNTIYNYGGSLLNQKGVQWNKRILYGGCTFKPLSNDIKNKIRRVSLQLI